MSNVGPTAGSKLVPLPATLPAAAGGGAVAQAARQAPRVVDTVVRGLKATGFTAASTIVGAAGGLVIGGEGMQALLSFQIARSTDPEAQYYPVGFVAGNFGAPLGALVGAVTGAIMGAVGARRRFF